MASSIYSIISKIAKRVTGIKDFSLWRKDLHKRVGKLIYHKKYDSKELVEQMMEMGMKTGSMVCVHSSMKEFYNYIGTPEDLINEILMVIGPSGTLIMPAFPKIPKNDCSSFVFNPRTDPTGAGLLAETFRKFPDVKRSNNVQHSVCAIGKYAEELIKDHTAGKDCWDEKSPWYKMCEYDALVFNLGLPRSYIYPHKYPYIFVYFVGLL